MTRVRTIVVASLLLVVVGFAAWEAFKWTVMRVYVPHDKALVVINKFGRSLPPDRLTVPADDDGYKGIREEVLGPGRYFFNPIEYDTALVDLVKIPAGEPSKWDWDDDGNLKDANTAPMIGLVSLKEGRSAPDGQEIVDPGFKGIQKAVLTPGTYKINPHRYEVKILPAVVVPPGSVGVVTRLTGDVGEVKVARLTEIRDATPPTTAPAAQDVPAPLKPDAPSRLVAGPTQRGILADVLQPGIYYLNPRMTKVTIVPVGYDAITLEHPTSAIRFYSYDGYQVEADFTVVWGRTPADAPNILANIGNTDKVSQNVIEPAMKAACQNEGAKYTAKELIQGVTRSKFQDDLSASLEKQVASRNIHVLLALVRNISIKDTSGNDATEGLLATIQRANIEVERELTNKQKTQTATVQAALEEALKQVDIARQTVASETNVKVADITAEANKTAAEIAAQRDLDVATIQMEVAALAAQRTEILGKAGADVERMKREAEARGAKMLVDALGSPQAYNQYVFAKAFEPHDLRLIFAGPGTFWTDLKSFQEIGASQILQPKPPQAATPPRPAPSPDAR